MSKQKEKGKENFPELRSFILYLDYWSAMERMTMEERGQIITAIYEYIMTGALPDFNDVMDVTFQFIRSRLDWDIKKWERACRDGR